MRYYISNPVHCVHGIDKLILQVSSDTVYMVNEREFGPFDRGLLALPYLEPWTVPLASVVKVGFSPAMAHRSGFLRGCKRLGYLRFETGRPDVNVLDRFVSVFGTRDTATFRFGEQCNAQAAQVRDYVEQRRRELSSAAASA